MDWTHFGGGGGGGGGGGHGVQTYLNELVLKNS